MHWTTPELLPAISKRGAFVGNNILEYTEKQGYGETQYPQGQYNGRTTMQKYL